MISRPDPQFCSVNSFPTYDQVNSAQPRSTSGLNELPGSPMVTVLRLAQSEYGYR